MTTPRYPDVHVRLVGEDGNVFAIIARVCRALRRAGEPEAASAFAGAAMQQESYDDVLRLVLETVDAD
jgi:hypothetical protein